MPWRPCEICLGTKNMHRNNLKSESNVEKHLTEEWITCWGIGLSDQVWLGKKLNVWRYRPKWPGQPDKNPVLNMTSYQIHNYKSHECTAVIIIPWVFCHIINNSYEIVTLEMLLFHVELTSNLEDFELLKKNKNCKASWFCIEHEWKVAWIVRFYSWRKVLSNRILSKGCDTGSNFRNQD